MGKRSYTTNLFTDYEAVLAVVETKSDSVARARLSAALVALNPSGDRDFKPRSIKKRTALKQLSDKLRALCKKRNEEDENQTMSEKHAKNWTDMATLKEIQKSLSHEALSLIKTKGAGKEDYSSVFSTIQDWVISSLYTLDHAPRRNEYADMRIIQYDDFLTLTEKQRKLWNWLLVRKLKDGTTDLTFWFYNYKTRRKFGAQCIIVKPELHEVLLTWLKVNKSSWLLLNKQFKKMSRNVLSITLPKVFSACNKKIGSCMIRHIFVSDYFEGDSSHNERKYLAREMGHSIECQQLQYRKIS